MGLNYFFKNTNLYTIFLTLIFFFDIICLGSFYEL